MAEISQHKTTQSSATRIVDIHIINCFQQNYSPIRMKHLKAFAQSKTMQRAGNGKATDILYTAGRQINMGRPFFWRHLPVPAWTIDLELRAAGNSAGTLTPPSCTPQNHSVPLITQCLNLPHVTSQCNVARDWVRYAPFCFCCDSRGRKWGPQHHRFITGPPTPPTKRQNGGLLSYIARWYISSGKAILIMMIIGANPQ